MATPHTDEELVAFVLAGNAQHFSELYHRYITSIYRFILVSVRHKETAEDITSTVFIKALERIHTYRASAGPFKAWLYGIARNALMDYYRSRGREITTDELPELPFYQGIESGADANRAMKKLDDALKGMEPELRQIMTLRLWDEVPFADIARIVGKSEGAVKMSFYRALDTLRAVLTIVLVTLMLAERAYRSFTIPHHG